MPINNQDQVPRRVRGTHGLCGQVTKTQGFSLIEILVVLFIIGIIFGLALLAFGDFGASRRVVSFGSVFKQDIQQLQYQAIVESKTLGLRLSANGYSAWMFAPANGWQTIADRRQQHVFPAKVWVRWMVKKSKPGEPDILFEPSGDMTPFQIQLGLNAQTILVRLIGTSDGQVALSK